jgi:hypothetical protein
MIRQVYICLYIDNGRTSSQPGWAVFQPSIAARTMATGNGLSTPIPWPATQIGEFENLVLLNRFKQCVVEEVPAFPVGFEADDAGLNMASFFTGCFANRANEPEGKVALNHTSFLLPFDPESR